MTELQVTNLSKTFGGVVAVHDLSFSVDAGTVHSLIGPNGAGKTTVLNLVTGVYRPNGGRVVFDCEDITDMRPEQLAARGVSRTFQNLQIFFNMSAVENVMVGRHLHVRRDFFAVLLRLPDVVRSERVCRAQAEELMHRVGVGDFVGAEAASMPFGALKRLEIARALASEPKLLLLDEPAAGLNPTETQSMTELIRDIAGMGVAVVLVEHDMRLVMQVSHRIVVLDNGAMLAEGTAAEIQQNPKVIEAYFGRELDHA